MSLGDEAHIRSSRGLLRLFQNLGGRLLLVDTNTSKVCRYRFSCIFNLTDRALRDDVLTNLGNMLKTLVIPKNAIGWDLETLESVVRDTSPGETDSDDEELFEDRPTQL